MNRTFPSCANSTCLQSRFENAIKRPKSESCAGAVHTLFFLYLSFCRINSRLFLAFFPVVVVCVYVFVFVSSFFFVCLFFHIVLCGYVFAKHFFFLVVVHMLERWK